MHEIMRCLNAEGSAFITGTYHNLGLISRLCQIKGYGIINKINRIIRNSRPQVSRTRLQYSYQEALWIAKDLDSFRYNYRVCKRNEYPGDYLARRNAQLRDSWDILSNGHENKAFAHPSPKPLALYMRMLDCAGKPGGLLLDLFSGSGTGAIAAMRWGRTRT